jgi:predicted extracellular nuclease
MKRILQCMACVGFTLISFSLFSQHVVINEVYGGGGNSGSIYKNDFIELYNPTGLAVDLNGWSVQYASATGSSWQVTSLSGSIAAGAYYLIQESAGAGVAASLPTPDATGSITMSATAGKVALVSSITALTGTCPVGFIDLVGYGSTANCFETSPTSPPSNTLSVERKMAGTDTDNNSADFQTSNPPTPINKIVEFTSGYPKTQSITATDLEIVVNLNKVGTAYFVILPSGSTSPTSLQVKNGLDAVDVSVAFNFRGSVNVTSASIDVAIDVTGLAAATGYDIYVVAENTGGLQSVPVKLEVTTVNPNVPNISLNVTSIIFDGYTDKVKQSSSESYVISGANIVNEVSVTVSGNYLISKDNDIFSTSLNYIPSDFSTDQTVYVRFNPDGNTGTQTGTITHSSTDATNKQVSLSAIAIDPYHQNFNDPSFLINSGWTQYSKVGVQVWASTNFGRTCLTGCNAGTTDKAAQINGFSGGAVANEDWLVSPQLDLSAYENFAAMSFWTISAFSGDVLQLKYSTDYSGSGDPAMATWTTLDGKFPSANSNLWTQSSNVLLPKADHLYIAFIYSSTTVAASRWTIDDWQVEDISSFINVPNFNFSFGEVTTGNTSASQLFVFDGQGYGDIALTVSEGYLLSKDDITFSSSLTVNEEEALNGQTIYVRFAPGSQQLKWPGAITFSAAELEPVSRGLLSGSSYPRAITFDVTAYNLEFFGTDVHGTDGNEFGPADDALQISNVTTVMQTIQSDVFSVEEISDDAALDQLVAGLPGYEKVMADRWSYSFEAPDLNFPPQKIGFIYNTSTVQVIDSRVMFANLFDNILAADATLPDYPEDPSHFWSSGRLPFMVTADVTINSVKKRVKMISLHSKSGSAQADYDRRKYDVQVLYDSLIAHYPDDNLIILGDFNDDVDESINTGHESTYKAFVDDRANFKVLTYELSQNGGYSFLSSGSFLDHIIISNELFDSYVENSIVVEDPRSYISNYATTTSDHLPVSARFALKKSEQAITFTLASPKAVGDQPFSLNATSSSHLPVSYESSDPTIASIEGNTVTILRTGTVDITASQSGNDSYEAAEDVVRTLVVDKANQTIVFDLTASKTLGDAPFVLNATSSSGLLVSFVSSNPAIVSIEGNTAKILKTGTVNITASQSGNDRYEAAEDVVHTLVIDKADQTITFASIPDKTVSDEPFTLSATSNSGLTVVFASSSDKVSINGNEVTVLKPGRATIVATQSGNESYKEAVPVDHSFCIKPLKPAITTSGQNTETLLTSSAASGNQWYFNGEVIPEAMGATFNANASGVYKVQAKVDDCVSDFSAEVYIVITGLSEKEWISLYPNPAEDYLIVTGIVTDLHQGTIVDMSGRTISLSAERIDNDKLKLDIQPLNKGIYLLRITDGEASHLVKFVKN